LHEAQGFSESLKQTKQNPPDSEIGLMQLVPRLHSIAGFRGSPLSPAPETGSRRSEVTRYHAVLQRCVLAGAALLMSTLTLGALVILPAQLPRETTGNCEAGQRCEIAVPHAPTPEQPRAPSMG
jgi:hypothetical protein